MRYAFSGNHIIYIIIQYFVSFCFRYSPTYKEDCATTKYHKHILTIKRKCPDGKRFGGNKPLKYEKYKVNHLLENDKCIKKIVIFQCRNGSNKKKQMEILELKNFIMLVKQSMSKFTMGQMQQKKVDQPNLKLVSTLLCK